MASKNFSVNISFTADAAQARRELEALKYSLNTLMTQSAKGPSFKLTQEIQDANRAVAQLKTQLSQATDWRTGNLDLTKFDEAMKKSGMSLSKYQDQLYTLGLEGEKAFVGLVRSITMADVPLKRSSKLLDDLWTTMKNTAKWQLTSSTIHGFMGAVQTAYGYAQDLNSSLNEIRIVTGASVDKMAEFAREANAAAKALSATTTDYTNASLIFYQQGLSDSQVKERTDITIKMANAANASAETVSDQLTAVWNNFYDGSKSLEYYADVMTALGAATASSTDEISQGLNKFAAVTKTIGLSYEYATAALTTITSNTRESADVVGNSLKTLFARIQGLQLGETLDDGTTLNKYSEALNKIGISIYDTSGDLKAMDNILDEMADKWGTLNKVQQTALAQTVAGVRQYNQLVALMDNWNTGDADSMVANLDTATNATGALDTQADIYAESWEAASDRVQAATETVYQTILNDEFFIDLTNGFAILTDGVKVFIDSLGGVKGVLLAIGSIITNVFSKQISESMQRLAFNLKGFFNPNAIVEEQIKRKKEANDLLVSGFIDTDTITGRQNAAVYERLGAEQTAYIQNVTRLSEEEKAINQLLMDRNQILADQAIRLGEQLEMIDNSISRQREALVTYARDNKKKYRKSDTDVRRVNSASTNLEKIVKASKFMETLTTNAKNAKGATGELFDNLKAGIVNAFQQTAGSFEVSEVRDFLQISSAQASSFISGVNGAGNLSALSAELEKVFLLTNGKVTPAMDALRESLRHFTGGDSKAAKDLMEDFVNELNKFGSQAVEAADGLHKFTIGTNKTIEGLEDAPDKLTPFSQAFVQAASAIMAVGQVLSSIQGVIQVFNDNASTTGDKIFAIVSVVGMLIPAVFAIIPAFESATVAAAEFGITSSLAMWQVTLIAMAITGLVTVIALLVTAESDYERQARKAAETAESMKSAADEAKQSFENLKAAFDTYDTAVEKLEECREGTEEWNAALKAVNDTVLDILENSPELAKNANLFVRDANGNLTINHNEREAILAQAERNANVMSAGAVMAQAQATRASANLEASQLASKINTSNPENTQYYYGDIGKILTDNALELANLTEAEYKTKVKELLGSQTTYSNQINYLIDDCVKYQSQINILAENTEAAANQIRNASLILADQQLDKYEAAERTIAANQYDDSYDRIYNEIISRDAKDNSKILQSSATSAEIWRRYNDAMGTNLIASTNQIQGTDKNRVYAYKGESGEETVTIEHIAATIAASEALQEMGQSAAEASNILKDLETNLGQENADIIKGFIVNKNFDDAIQSNFVDFYKQVAQSNPSGVGHGAASKEDVAWYLDNAFEGDNNGIIDDETAKKYGYETGQLMVDAIYESLTNANEVWDSLQIEELVGFETLSMDAAVAIDNAFKKVSLGPRGEEAGKEFINGLNDMVDSLDGETRQQALTQLANVDWTSWDALSQAESILDEFGITIDVTSDQWKEFAISMRIANNSMPDFSKLQEHLQNVSSILGDLEFDDVIEDEDYEKLVDYNREWEKFFILQADGTRKFIGDSEEMVQATRDNITAQREELKERKQLVDEVIESQADWKISAKSIDEEYGDGKDGKLSDDNAKTNGYASGEDMLNNVMADQAQDLIDSNTAIKEILNSSEYSDEVIAEILQEARDGNRARLETLLGYVDAYMSQDLNLAEEEIVEMMASTATSIAELNKMVQDGQVYGDAYTRQLEYLAQSGANAAETLTELDAIWSQALTTGSELDYSIYADNLLRLSESYSICADEAKEFEIALLSGSSEAVKVTEENLEASIMLGEAAKKYNLEAEELSVQSKQLAKEYNLDAKAAAQLTIENQRMNQGVEDLVDNWKKWKKELKATDKTSRDWAKAAKDCTKVIADLVGASEDLELPEDFFDSVENLELLEKAAKGSKKAINELGVVVARAQIKMMEFQEGMTNESGELIDLSQFDSWKNTILSGLDSLQTALDDIGIGDNVYERLGGANWVNALNQMAIATQMSVEQMNSLLNSMGVQAKVEVRDVPQTMSVPTYTEYSQSMQTDPGEKDANGMWITPPTWSRHTWTVPGPSKEVDGYVQVAQISTEGSNIGPPKITYTGNGGVSSSAKKGGKSGGGGGGSKKKPAEKPKKSDIVERYKEVNDLLDDMADAMEDASKAADRLYGKGRLDLMKKNNDLLKQEIELTKQKKKEALKYLDEDLDAMFKAAADAGVILTTDENGLISNYTEVMTELYNELNAEVAKANRDGNASESEQARIDKIQERIDALKDAMKQYDETRELIEDLDNELDEKFYQWQDNNYEMLTYELEIKLELNEDELKLIDYYLNKISDDFYQMAEAAALMVGSDGISQLEMYTSNLSNYEEHVNSLKEAYANGEISQAAYVEGLREARDEMLSNLESLNDLDETMIHYYGETLSMAAEELAKYTDHMEHLTKVLDHYQSLMEIMGKSTDYEAMGLVLEGKAKALGDQAAVAKATMEMYKDEAEDRYQAYQQALLDGDEAAAELYLQQYRDALAAADEAEQEYLASAEEWAEALTAVLENKLSKFGQTLENALTGGTSFDQMTTAMERAASLQEEYLTTTNKIYETNKLMRRAQQEIDKTSNSVAKRRLKSFIEETYQLQNQTQLSNYELEIQQAKYDLLLAEIALEEAQNAKSIVRLQRDSEGNFGYVYTADGAAVSEAEQNMLDKQNNLYNIALQGANDYSQKYQQTLNEMYSTLTDLQQQYLEGAFESEEEYHAAVEAAKKYYYDKLQQYSSLHTVAITLDSRVINDAWSAGFNDMLTKTEEWMEAVDIYLDDVGVAFMEWSEYMDQIAADTGTNLDSLEKNVKDITDESKALKDILIGEDGKGGVVGAIKTEIEAVKNITESYATLRAELAKIKAAYEEVATAINATIRAQSQVSSNPGTSTTKYNSSSGGKQGSASEGASSGGSGGGGSGSGGSGGGTTNPGRTTDSGIRINLYAARHTSARMGSTLVKQSSKGSISFGSAEYAADNDPSIKMVYASGAGWHGYVTASDRRAIKQAYGFATGGYTGDWDGPYGKLAFLHQKELVLNKEDTENFLASMEVLERILQVIDLHSASSQIGGILSSPILGNTGPQDINQHISIEASFPNATDRFEIEEAFKSMANLASQYANRK